LSPRKPKGGLAQKIKRQEAEAAAAAEKAAGAAEEAAASSAAETAIEEAPLVLAPLTPELFCSLTADYINSNPDPVVLDRIFYSKLRPTTPSSVEINEVFGDLQEQPQPHDLTNMVLDDAALPGRADPPDVLNQFYGGNLLSQESIAIAIYENYVSREREREVYLKSHVAKQ